MISFIIKESNFKSHMKWSDGDTLGGEDLEVEITSITLVVTSLVGKYVN